MKKGRRLALPISVGMIGFGRMGSALALGAVRAGVLKSSNVTAIGRSPESFRKISSSRIRSTKDVREVVAGQDLVFLCVKPHQMAGVLKAVRPVNESLRRRPCFVSIAAGVRIAALESGLGAGTPVIRAMPNTPSLLGAGMSGMCLGADASARHGAWVRRILESVGDVADVTDAEMDAVTAVSGSGPAYVFYLAEALIDAATAAGLSPETARTLARQTIFGAGRMLKERPEPAEELRRQVTSPGGTTAAAVAVFDERSLRSIVIDAVARATERSRELSKLQDL